MIKKIILLSICFVLFILINKNYAQYDAFNDTIAYKCKIKKIQNVSEKFVLLTIEVFLDGKWSTYDLLTSFTEPKKEYEKIKKGKTYFMYLSYYDEPYKHIVFYGDNRNVEKWEVKKEFLINDKTIKLPRTLYSPVVVVSPNVKGLYYTQPDIIKNKEIYGIEFSEIEKFIYTLINSIKFSMSDSVFKNIIDQKALEQNLEAAYEKKFKVADKTSIISYIRDSIYRPNRKLDSIYFNKNYKAFCPNIQNYLMLNDSIKMDIVLCQDSFINVKVKWKTISDYYPRISMIALKRSKNGLKMIGFVNVFSFKNTF